MKKNLALLSLAILLLAACTKTQEIPDTELNKEKTASAKKVSNVKIAATNSASFVYSGDNTIFLSYDDINGYIYISYIAPPGTSSTPWFLTVQSISGGSTLADNQMQTEASAMVHHKMSDGDVLFIKIRAADGTNYIGSFYDASSDGAVYSEKSSPFPVGFHWTVSTIPGDTLGLVHIDWTLPTSGPTPNPHDKYYFYYFMYDHTKNEVVQYADSASIFDGKMTLGKPYFPYNYDYINVKVYIKGLRMLNEQQFHIDGITNGEFVQSSNTITPGTIQEYGTQLPGCSINNGVYSYSPVNIIWQ